MPKFSINFLGADVPLTKRFRSNGEKDAYPMVKNFTSFTERVETIQEFYGHLTHYAESGHCLLKGQLTRTLNNESRAGSTRTDDTTMWICLDFDRYPTPDIDLTLKQFGLHDITYIIQYSASHGLDDTMGTLSAHVFMLLDQPVAAPTLKAWLMGIGLKHTGIALSRSKSTLRWALDITTCQNDKLIYIAPPVFEKPLQDPLHKRIKLVKRKNPHINVSTTIGEQNINALKKAAREYLNKLREDEGLPKRTAQTSWEGPVEIQNKPDACTVTGVKDCGDWIRLNINGGDSWAYSLRKDNPKLIHDFKSGEWYRTKEFVPGYWAELMSERAQAVTAPTADGDLVLAFCELKTAEYYRGLWNPETQDLKLYKARDRTQLNDWWMSFDMMPPDFVETWEIAYDPLNDWIVDEENKRINTFRCSPYMKLEPDPSITPKNFPNIYGMVRHFLGETGKSTEITDHFLNWFAVLFQRKDKPTIAWVNHGIQGTGKGYFMLRVVRPLFGEDNVAEVGIANIEDQFNGWQEGKLFINVNEINADDFTSKGRVEAKFKMLIADKWMPVRRMRQTMTQERNYASYLFSSNENRPVIIAMDDRRHNVANRQNEKLVPPKEEDVANELEAFAKWLLAHKADVKLASEILHTEARSAIQKLGVNSFQETCHDMTSGNFDALWMNMIDDEYLQRTSYNEDERTYNALIKDIGKRILEDGVRQTLSRDEMGIILQRNVGGIAQEPNKLTSRLRQNGIETKQIRHKGRKTYGIHVVWHIGEDIRREVEAEVLGRPKLRRAK